MTSDELDIALEVWGRYILADKAILRRLSYPSSTPEYRYARSGGFRSNPNSVLSPDFEANEVADRVDKAMAQLRNHRLLWFKAVFLRVLHGGPDQFRAEQLKMKVDLYRETLQYGKRWLRRHI